MAAAFHSAFGARRRLILPAGRYSVIAQNTPRLRWLSSRCPAMFSLLARYFPMPIA